MRGVLRLQLDEFFVCVARALELAALHTGVSLEFENLGDHGAFAGALEEVVQRLQSLRVVAYPGDGAVQMRHHIFFVMSKDLNRKTRCTG